MTGVVTGLSISIGPAKARNMRLEDGRDARRKAGKTEAPVWLVLHDPLPAFLQSRASKSAYKLI
jgi:hypothetical protein